MSRFGVKGLVCGFWVEHTSPTIVNGAKHQTFVAISPKSRCLIPATPRVSLLKITGI